MGAGRAKIFRTGLAPGAGFWHETLEADPIPFHRKEKNIAGQTTNNLWSTGAMVCPTMVQVTNVSPLATTQQMKELFSYLGDIVDIKLYPGDQAYVTGSYKLPTP